MKRSNERGGGTNSSVGGVLSGSVTTGVNGLNIQDILSANQKGSLILKESELPREEMEEDFNMRKSGSDFHKNLLSESIRVIEESEKKQTSSE